MITLSSCPICSGSSFTDYLNCIDYTTTGESFSLKQCTNCNFTFTDPKPDEESIGKYYESKDYISHTGGQKTLIDSIYLFARTIALKNKRKIIEKNTSGKSILDFGCGTGSFLNEMQTHGWNTIGVEPSPHANEKAQQINRGKIYKTINEINESNLDAISLWHVLEHVHDINGTLQKFKTLLKDSGAIFIAVPNLKSYDAQFYKTFWAAYDVPRHLWHFSQENMKILLANNGFKLVEVLPMKMDSFYVSLLSESYKNPNQSKVISFLRASIKGFISNMKARKNKNYSSLIYIAKR